MISRRQQGLNTRSQLLLDPGSISSIQESPSYSTNFPVLPWDPKSHPSYVAAVTVIPASIGRPGRHCHCHVNCHSGSTPPPKTIILLNLLGLWNKTLYKHGGRP